MGIELTAEWQDGLLADGFPLTALSPAKGWIFAHIRRCLSSFSFVRLCKG